MKTRRPNFILSVSASALLASLLPVQAVDFTWINPGTGDWATPGNWNNGTPGGGGGNFVIINNGGTANITSTTNPIQDPFIGRGAGAVGHVNQTAGDHTNSGWTFIGTEGGTGTWDLSGSTNFTSGRIYLGGRRESDGGNGTMTVATTGTVTSAGDLSIGSRGGTGTLNVSNGTVNAASWMIIGETTAGSGGSNGMVNQTGGVVRNAATDAGGRLWLGSQEGNVIGAASTGTYNLLGGTLTARNISIGKDYTGIFNQSGGIANFATGADDTRIGANLGSTGSYTLSGGVLNSAGNFQIGAFGNGTMTVSGGTLNNAGWLVAGRFAGGTGAITVSSGTINHNDSGTTLIVGEAGTGSLTVNGTGLVNVNSALGLRIGHTGSANGTIYLDGGTLAANFIQKTDAGSIAKINLNGGILKANASSPDFFVNMSNANLEVQGGGAKFDTNGFATTITQELDGAGGFTKLGNGTLTLASPTNAYAGITTISGGTLSVPIVSSGGAPSTLGASSGAAASLVFDGGALQYTGGSTTFDRGYTANPAKNATFDVSTPGSVLTLTGGGTGAGGFTKVGNGTLSLVGAALPSGTVNANGGVLAASGTYVNAFAVSGGGHLTAQDAAAGTLSVPTLALNAASNADFEFDGGAGLNTGHDIITIANSGGLALSNTGLFLYQTGTTSPFTANGTYTLFDYTGSFTGNLGTAFTIANSQIGKLYQISNNAAATTIQLSIADVVSTTWVTNGGGLWTNAANWSAGVPDSFGAIATFGSALTSGPATVTLNGPKTVGILIFDNANSYTLAGGAGDLLTLNNGSGTPLISQLSGSHTVAAPISLFANTNAAPAAGTVLTLAGSISGAGNLSVTDAGTIVLTGANSYAATNVNSGTLNVGDGGAGGTLGTGPVALATGTSLTFNRSTALAVSNNISGAGAVTHAGTGSLTYSGAATYTGATILNGPFINDGTIRGTASLDVESTATLRGSSVLTVATTVNIGSTAPAAVALQDSAALNLTGTSPLVIGDNISGSLTMSGNSVLNDPAVVNTASRGTNMGDVIVGRTSGSLNVWTLGGAASAHIRELRVGDIAGSNGEVNINGSATVDSSYDFHIGRAGTGTVNLNGGSLSTNTGWTQIGIEAGSTGSLNMSGGTFTSREIRVGENGTGNLTLTGGTMNGTQQLTAGANTGSSGTIAVSGTAVLNLSNGASIAGNGDGAIALSGGTINDAGNFIIGNGGTRTGQVFVTGGTFNVNSGELWVGQNTGGNGTLDVTAGTVNVNNWLAVGRQNATGLVTLGGTGVINKKGINHTIVGSLGGVGTVTQTGGSFNSTASSTPGGSGGIRLGENAGSISLWDISGGTATADFISIGWAGGASGELRVSGTAVMTAENNVIVAESGPGMVNLNGGTLRTTFVTVGTGAAQFNFNGGILSARANEGDFIRGFNSSNLAILGGGAKLDTNGFNITVGAPLTGVGAVTKIGNGTLTLTGLQDYPVLNTQAGRTDLAVAVGTGTTTVNANAVTNFGVDQTLGALNIGNGGVVTLGALPPPAPEPAATSAPDPADLFAPATELAGNASVGAVPEPGSTLLLLSGLTALLTRRRR